MGLFDLFKGGAKGGDGKASSAVQKYADTATAKRAQTYERQEAIGKLCDIGTVEAAAALLKRFTFQIDPSITDQEEKETAFRGILAVGPEVLPAVRTFAQKAESLSWPMRVVKELVSEDDYVRELLAWLARWDTEYAKFIDPKLQILAALEDHKHGEIRAAVERFLEDVNEPARFHAVTALFVQEDPAAATSLARALAAEESFRVKNKIVDGFASRGWLVPEDLRDVVASALPPGAAMASDGALRR
ncbi:MAG: HEAT repeat domain-containing protein [Myxococcales bacterium]|nr:HEAT repeat domain-containing protein [Myxococcales bacterium]